MPYGGYGGGYNPLLLEESKQNPFYNPYSASPDYWGGTASILTNLWKAKQLQEQQAYERAMAERKMSLEERQAGGKATQTPDELMRVQMMVAGGVPLQEAFKMVGGYKQTQPELTPEQQGELEFQKVSGRLRAEQKFGQPKEDKSAEKLYTRQNALVGQAATKLNTLLEGPSGLGKQLKDLENWGATYIDKEVPKEKRGTEAGLSVQTKRYRELSRKVAVLQAAKERLNELQDKLARQETLTPDEEGEVRTLLTRPESFMSKQPKATAGARTPSIFQEPQSSAPKIGGPPPQAGMFSGQVATNKKTGQKFIWNGESWQPIK